MSCIIKHNGRTSQKQYAPPTVSKLGALSATVGEQFERIEVLTICLYN